jgi:hypothetical protein
VGPILFPQLATWLAGSFFGASYSAGAGKLPPLAKVICYWLQSGNLWRIETSVIRWVSLGQFADLGTERGSCERIDKLARTSIIDWLEESCGCWSGITDELGWESMVFVCIHSPILPISKS